VTAGIVRIEGVVQTYAWGSTTAIPALLGVEPTTEPQAELWLGAHPLGPARLDDGRRLGDALDSRLPFLLKVLAAAAPLSLQAHPSPEQAARGYQREEAAGVPLDAPHRNYRDPNHKPELICPLGRFEALCGFRDPAVTVDLLRSLDVAALAPVIDPLAAGDVRAALGVALGASPEVVSNVVDACRQASHERFGAERSWVIRLAEGHPGDAGVVVALLLNLVVLGADEALELPAGNLHAYLEGVGIELMANSDNVLRAGLTSKHVDVPELMAILDCTSMEVSPIRPHVLAPGVELWDSAAADFRLTRLRPDRAGGTVRLRPQGPEILLVVDGAVRAGDLPLGKGQAAFVPPGIGNYAVTGTGTVYRATVGTP